MLESLKDFLRKIFLLKSEVSNDKNIEWLGNNYGGFFVDISLINSDSVIISVGIGEDISFDLAMKEKGVKHIYLFDPTPKAKIFIEKLNLSNTFFSFYDIALSDRDSHLNFYLPKNPNYVSGSLQATNNINKNDYVLVQCLTLKSICKLINENKIDVLKIDIEGAEYEVLENILENQIFPIQLCVEFHNRFFEDGEIKYNVITRKLIDAGYEIKGVSKSKEEFLFIYQNAQNL